MTKKNRKHKKHRAKWHLKMRAFLPFVYAIFNPLHAFLDEIEKEGTMDTIDGKAVVKSWWNKEYYEMSEAALGLADLFEIWMKRTGNHVDLTGIKQIANRAKYDAPITELEVKSAKESVRQMQNAMMNMTWGELERLKNDTAIKHELMESGA